MIISRELVIITMKGKRGCSELVCILVNPVLVAILDGFLNPTKLAANVFNNLALSCFCDLHGFPLFDLQPEFSRESSRMCTYRVHRDPFPRGVYEAFPYRFSVRHRHLDGLATHGARPREYL